METQSALGLRIPERTAAPAGCFLDNPKEVEAWITTLPVANVGETSRQVFKTVVELNRLELSNPVRIKVAELLREPISYITDNLRKYYFDAPFPLSAKNRKIAVLNKELYSELATAYKIFIENMLSGNYGKFDRKLLVISIHRAIRYLSIMIYQSAIIYDPFPTGSWKEIHRLFSYAEQNRIDDILVKEGKGKATSSISDQYKQMLLFSIGTPYRLRQREIEHIFNKLPDWSKQVILDTPDGKSKNANHFIVNLRSDSPPFHMELRTQEPDEHSRIIDTQGLVQTLRSNFEELPQERSSSEAKTTNIQISKHLLRQLLNVYSTASKREFVRTKLNFELTAAVGLTAIHSLLRADRKTEDPTPSLGNEDLNQGWVSQARYNPGVNAVLYTSQKQKLELSSTEQTFGEETYLTGTEYDSSFGPSGTPSWLTDESEKIYETFSCKTFNESAGGYCINWQGINAPKIRIGEIVGIQSAIKSGQFGIGISRWMKNSSNQGLQVGLEMISPSSTAVQVHIEDKSNLSSPQKGLMLPELAASGRPASLIVPTLPFKVGNTLRIIDGDNKQEIRLTRLLESTGAFAQFQFTYQGKDHEGKHNDGTDEDFDNIWSAI